MLLTHAFHTHLLIDIRPVIETEYAYILVVQSEIQIWVQNCVVISSVGQSQNIASSLNFLPQGLCMRPRAYISTDFGVNS